MEFIIAAIYVLLGLFGGIGHWAKKKYIDDTTEQNLIQYLKNDWTATKKSVFTILTSEIALSVSSEAVLPGFGAVVGAITLGYSADSALNRASDSHKIQKENE